MNCLKGLRKLVSSLKGGVFWLSIRHKLARLQKSISEPFRYISSFAVAISCSEVKNITMRYCLELNIICCLKNIMVCAVTMDGFLSGAHWVKSRTCAIHCKSHGSLEPHSFQKLHARDASENHRFYYVPMHIGDPPRPYFLDPDTGSDLTWLQCDAPCIRCTRAPHPLYKPSSELVHSRDPLCAAVQPEYYKCESPEQCDYEVEYADGGSSLGVLLKDAASFNLTNGLRSSPRLAIGCGYDQIPGSSHHPLDGVLGLGKGKVSIVSQLSDQGITRNVVGHCLSAQGGGYLFFGDNLYDPSRIDWTPMSRQHSKHYSPGFAELIYGRQRTGVENLFVVFDSGSSYTYFASQAYQNLISLITRDLHRTSLKDATDDDTLPVCWKGKRPFKSIRDVRKYFKPLALSFKSGSKSAAHFDIPPENYLIISIKGNVCLGILNGTQVGLQSYNIIGDISMQDKVVVYDNERNMIGWAMANCDKIPKGKAVAS